MRGTVRILTAMLLLFLLPCTAFAAELSVEGKSALLMEVETGRVLQESNAHERLAPASVTKIMTMLLIMEAVDSGKIAMTDMVTASEAAAAKGGSQVYLKVGETMSVSEMLKCIAVSSANDCACAMAEHIAGSEEAFVALMNQKAKELGIDIVTTTMIISPHKNFKQLTEVGNRLANKYGVEYLAVDFKKKDGFLKTNRISKELGIYRQNYCGCRFAKRD